MKDLTAYQKIFEALINEGYSETEAEELLCQVIQDQIDYSDAADRIHKIFTEQINNKKFWS